MVMILGETPNKMDNATAENITTTAMGEKVIIVRILLNTSILTDHNVVSTVKLGVKHHN